MEMIFSMEEVLGLEFNRFFRGKVIAQIKFPDDERDDPDYLEFELFKFGGDPLGITVRRAHGFRFRELWVRPGTRTERGRFSLAFVKKAMESFDGEVLNSIDEDFREEFIQLVQYLRRLARAEVAANRKSAEEADFGTPRHEGATTNLGEALAQAEPVHEYTEVEVSQRPRRPNGKRARKAAERAKRAEEKQLEDEVAAIEADEMLRADQHLLEVC